MNSHIFNDNILILPCNFLNIFSQIGGPESSRPKAAAVGLARPGPGQGWGWPRRASLARALVTKPDTLLMDEPFSALDALTRRQMHDVFLDLWSQTGLTVLFVTHDLEEAVLLSDRVVAVAGQPLTIAADHIIALPRPRQRHSPAVQQRVLQLEQTLEASP